MFSILTEQELGSFWERTILPLVFLGLSFGFPAQRVNDPHTPDAIANGQFILIKRSVYDQVGGHAAVKERVDEDKAIATLVKRAGYRLMHRRWAQGCPHAHVYLPARDVGRLDEEYLPGTAG